MMAETLGSSVAGRPGREPLEWEKAAIDAVTGRIGEELQGVLLDPAMPVLVVAPGSIVEVADALKEVAPDVRFPFLLDVTAVDYLEYSRPAPERFAVVWHFLHKDHCHRIRVKAFVADGDSVPSLTGMYDSADWCEREVFDMMGIAFSGHPDLRRILMPDDYEGNPQRKDFPIQGPDRPKRIRGELLGNKPLTSWKELHEI